MTLDVTFRGVAAHFRGAANMLDSAAANARACRDEISWSGHTIEAARLASQATASFDAAVRNVVAAVKLLDSEPAYTGAIEARLGVVVGKAVQSIEHAAGAVGPSGDMPTIIGAVRKAAPSIHDAAGTFEVQAAIVAT